MTEHERLQSAIAALEAQRESLGDAVVEASIAALRQQLADLEPQDERRKLVTVLFADLAGWTSMSEQMDPEQVREIQDAYIEAVTPPIQKYGGNVEKYIGDAVLAVFGVPSAHEDDPERAVHAALEMQSSLAELNDDLGTQHGLQLSLRVGVNSGLVVSRVKGGAEDFVVTGDTVNLASRLESAAPPGGVLISDSTFRQIGELFDIKVLAPLTLKGKAEPVPVYQVLATHSQVTKARGIAGLSSPLMGRAKEYEALQAALLRLSNGEGGIVTVVGEAGIGKSRLVSDIRSSMSEGSVQWVEGRCLSYGGTIAYLPWLEILRALVGAGPEDNPARVQEQLKAWIVDHSLGQIYDLYPFLGGLLSLPLEEDIQEMLDKIDRGARREGLFQAVERALDNAARQHPLVIVLEDLHWADPSSLALLKHVIPLIRQVPLLIICLFRPHQQGAPWEQLELAIYENAERQTGLKLNPLTVGDSEGLLDNLLGGDELPSELVERILSQAEGNPFYLEEVLRSLIDMQVILLDGEAGRWQVIQEIDTIAIPDTLQGVLIARIDRLERETRRLLQMAAVIGRTFLYRVLETIAEQERQLDQELLILSEEELIREHNRVPELEYIFKHALTQEAAYNGILKKHRRVFHQQVATALEDLFPERVEELLGLLAHHWERAENAHKAIEYLLRAGDQARNLYAHQEAVDYYQRALAIQVKSADYGEAARTLMKLGQTYHNAFDYRRANESYKESFRLWQRASDKLAQAPLPPAGAPLRLVQNGDPETLDPGLCSHTYSANVINLLFSGLLEYTPEMDVVPDLAHRWEILEGGRKYVFHLREDARWSDGTPVTAHDFVYAWKRLLNPNYKSPSANLLYDIKGARSFHLRERSTSENLGVQASGPYTLEVELEAPVGYFLQLMALPAAYPVPGHVVERLGDDWANEGNIIGNGPFLLQSWQRGNSITLARNPDYCGRFSGNLQQVEIACIPVTEWEIMLAKYEANELDILDFTYFPPAEMERLRRQLNSEYISLPGQTTFYFVFNTSITPFDDLRVRRAFMMSLDKGARARSAYEGADIPASGGLIPPGTPGHSPEIGIPYDPDRAQELMAQAGYPGGRGFPSVVILIFPGLEAILEDVWPQWRDVLGVELTWDFAPLLDFPERARVKPIHIVWQGWATDYPDPDNILRVGFNKDLSGWRDGTFERLINRARRLQDQAERIQLYQKADKKLIDEAIVLPLRYALNHLLVKPWVKNNPQSPASDWFLKDVIIEPHREQ